MLARLWQRDARHEGVMRVNIYLLRLLYALMFFMLGQTTWTEILTHQGQWEPNKAVAWTVWTAFATLAGLGLLRPVKMLPIILLEIFYKVMWLAIVAYPLWSRGELVGSPAESTTYAFLGVLLAIIAVPWGYIATSYFTWPSTAKPA
ncbi:MULTISPECIES: hypothetical protein [unclassified Duganella]|uniref:hypothetical protein n=1 Tax=unclassified Duganella TaxID=2636909 RepID=UPI0006F8546B|nr:MULTISPECIES: hypothetical protein [unclassified Duganella]KQV44705.1 hypothetical protein ASD07_19300 [Duganella sp. Root336D2]KRB83227.1 hypothetical protein ASE26_12140 [Duganella sp. Root198D2]